MAIFLVPMQIPASQIRSRRRVGRSRGRAVYQIGAVGGLHLVAAHNDGGVFEILGAGSHPAVARHLARRTAPDIEFDDLQKSEAVDPRDFADVLPRYAEVTADLRALQGYRTGED